VVKGTDTERFKTCAGKHLYIKISQGAVLKDDSK
jgi:hypothetical protein